MRHRYKTKNLSGGSLIIIVQANGIIVKYAEMGLGLTLRQLYYQFVSHDLFPGDRRFSWTGSKWVRDTQGTKNAPPNYKWLGGIIRDGRLAGLIDWAAIEDRTRVPTIWRHTENAQDAVGTLLNAVQKDRWVDQDVAVEVWVEKDALTGVVRKPCMALDVPYFACKGYNSSSAAYSAGQRILGRDKPTVILHLGDHDPSGMDMTHDNQKRFDMFTGGKATVKRIALNMDQIEHYSPPPNPAKIGDSRAKKYIQEFGSSSWELDALNPNDMQQLITDEISALIDYDKWNEIEDKEDQENVILEQLINSWDDVKEALIDGHFNSRS